MNTEAPTDGAAAAVLPQRPQFVLILQDGEDGQIEMAGAQHPSEFLSSSAAHTIGAWFRDNIESLAKIALAQAPEVIGEREKTILLPGSDSQAVVR